jgi:phosphinothricin acetyltransferase
MIEFVIRPLHQADWPAVRGIYEEGIATGHATFETAAPAWKDWDAEHVRACRLVAEADGRIVGWAALSPVSDRCAYGGVGEVSVYVAGDAQGGGLGTLLLEALVNASEEAGFWTLQAGIFPENVGSIRIHEKCGFRTLGVRERLGKLAGAWRSVLLMERRSSVVGTD